VKSVRFWQGTDASCFHVNFSIKERRQRMRSLHRKRIWLVFTLFVFLTLVSGSAFCLDKEVTRLSAVPPLHELKQFYHIPDFKIGGTSLLSKINRDFLLGH
jgi:hypothetical protein